MEDIRMVVGLGNPGGKYAETRHNMGFRVIDLVAEALNAEVNKRGFGARFGTGQYAGRKVVLLKPWRYMNLSGHVVATAAGHYHLAVEGLLVVTDDMALGPGRIRIRPKGSAGGHNGLADIIARLGTDGFARLRIGIGQSAEDFAINHVLGKPGVDERSLLEGAIDRAREAVLCWIEHGIDKAMNEFNAGPASQ
jgi:PTH1 family peptidyl-tRNA hydrolase